MFGFMRSAPPSMPALCGALAACCFATTALANEPHVEGAAQAYADLDFEVCIEEAQASLEGAARRNDRINAYRLLGLCQAALGELESAREAFSNMLAIDPQATLPEGLSPRFTSAYAEAKGALIDNAPLALAVEEEREEGKARVLLVAVTDPMGLIDRVAWVDGDGETSPGLKAASKMEVPVPVDVAVGLVGLDENDGVLTELDLRAKAEPVDPTPPPEVATATEAEGNSNATLMVATGVGAAAVVGAVVAVSAVVAGAMFYTPGRVDLRGSATFAE